MLIDVFSERGYHAVVDIHRIDVPERFDLTTGAISCSSKKVYRIQIRFPGLGNPLGLAEESAPTARRAGHWGRKELLTVRRAEQAVVVGVEGLMRRLADRPGVARGRDVAADGTVWFAIQALPAAIAALTQLPSLPINTFSIAGTSE